MIPTVMAVAHRDHMQAAACRRLEVTPELLRRLLRYDCGTGKLFWRRRSREMFANARVQGAWNVQRADKEAFTADNGNGHRKSRIFGVVLYAHRVVWAYVHGVWPDGVIDHVNGDPSDNRICNLRVVTHAENMRNMRLSERNTSGVCGVYRHKPSGKWIAAIKANGKSKHLGYFSDFRDAVEARKAADLEYGYHPNHGRIQ